MTTSTGRYMNEEQKAEIINHVKKWKKSGIPQSEYCRQNGIAISTFSRYKYKMEQEAKSGKTAKPSGFITVTSSDELFYDVTVGKATIKVPSAKIVGFIKEVNAND